MLWLTQQPHLYLPPIYTYNTYIYTVVGDIDDDLDIDMDFEFIGSAGDARDGDGSDGGDIDAELDAQIARELLLGSDDEEA